MHAGNYSGSETISSAATIAAPEPDLEDLINKTWDTRVEIFSTVSDHVAMLLKRANGDNVVAMPKR